MSGVRANKAANGAAQVNGAVFYDPYMNVNGMSPLKTSDIERLEGLSEDQRKFLKIESEFLDSVEKRIERGLDDLSEKIRLSLLSNLCKV